MLCTLQPCTPRRPQAGGQAGPASRHLLLPCCPQYRECAQQRPTCTMNMLPPVAPLFLARHSCWKRSLSSSISAAVIFLLPSLPDSSNIHSGWPRPAAAAAAAAGAHTCQRQCDTTARRAAGGAQLQCQQVGCTAKQQGGMGSAHAWRRPMCQQQVTAAVSAPLTAAAMAVVAAAMVAPALVLLLLMPVRLPAAVVPAVVVAGGRVGRAACSVKAAAPATLSAVKALGAPVACAAGRPMTACVRCWAGGVEDVCAPACQGSSTAAPLSDVVHRVCRRSR
jgi:hypothetical protein